MALKIADGRLIEHRKVWRRKPVLRQLYTEWYRWMMAYAVPGRTLEVGSGPGNLTEVYPEVLATDISFSPWLDLVAHACQLPVQDGSLQNLVMVDVLHHLASVYGFFREAQRALAPGGRIVMLEPYISPFSRIVFGLFHPEPVDMKADPLNDREALSDDDDPFDANQGIPTLLFWRDRKRFEAVFPRLKMVRRERCAFLAYPLSGGFEHRSLLPCSVVSAVHRLEECVPLLKGLLSFRCFCVLEYCP